MTKHGREYYAIVSRLRRAGFAFLSAVPGGEPECELVVTTRAEGAEFRGRVLALEDLDEDPDVVRGQILSLLEGGSETLLVGVDPGLRSGMASFYGDARLEFRTFDSRERMLSAILNLCSRVRAKKTLVRIGDGDPRLAYWMARRLALRLPDASVELVDESGTSARTPNTKGLRKDEGSAARIAFRRGVAFGP